jgi:hypothetical protein
MAREPTCQITIDKALVGGAAHSACLVEHAPLQGGSLLRRESSWPDVSGGYGLIVLLPPHAFDVPPLPLQRVKYAL